MAADRAPLRVLPDAERVEAALLAALEPGQVADGSATLTFAEFIDALEGPAALGRTLVDGATARLLVARTVAEADPGPFAPIAAQPGFHRALAALFADLKAGRCDPDGFARAARELPPERLLRASALARLYAAYESALAGAGLGDASDALAGAMTRLRDPAAALPHLLAGRDLVVEHVYDLSPARIELLLAVAERFERERDGRSVRVHLPYEPDRPAIGGFVESAFAELERRGATLGTLEIVPRHYQRLGAPPSVLAGAVFRRPWSPLGAPCGASVVAAPTPERERREIARRVRDLCDAGTAPESIAIALRDPSADADRFAEHLTRYGVPARVRRGAPLDRSRLARLALALPGLAARGFPREELIDLLGSGYLRRPGPRGAALARVLRSAGARDDGVGPAGYRARLRALERRAAARSGDAEARALASLARETLDAVEAVLAPLRALPERGTIEAHLRALAAALEALGVLRAARSPEPGGPGEDPLTRAALAALARDQAAAGALDEVFHGLAAAAVRAGIGARTIDRDGFARLLADFAGDAVLAAPGPRGGAVRLLDVRELLGLSVEHLFLAGLLDGRFPARPVPSAILPDEDRAAVNRALRRRVFRVDSPAASGTFPQGSSSSEPGRAPRQGAEDALLFHLALCAAQRSVCLSYAEADERGAEVLRSPFVDEVLLVGAASVEEVALAPVPAAERCRTAGELVARVAMERGSDPVLRTAAPDPAGASPRVHAALAAAGQGDRLDRAEALVAIERERLEAFAHPERAGPHSGRCDDADGLAAVARRLPFDANKPLSPRVLEDYGTCPFKSLLVHLVRLEEPEEPDEDLDARGRGTLHHAALERFFRRRNEAGALPLKGTDDEAAELWGCLDDAAAAFEREHHVGHPALWEIRLGEAKALLARLVRAEADAPWFPGLLPARFEQRFGTGGLPPLEVPSPDGAATVVVGGMADRIDGGNGGPIGVIDYKSSSADRLKRSLKDDLLVTVFQLPVYLAAARAALGAPRGDAAYLSIRDAEAIRLSDAPEARLDALLEMSVEARGRIRREAPPPANLADAVWRTVDKVRAGRFPVDPVDCGTCRFGAICRIGARAARPSGRGEAA